MKRISSLLASIICLTALVGSASAQVEANAETMHGVWNVDVAAMMAVQGAPPEAIAMAASMSMSITLDADGTMTMTAMRGEEEAQTETGTWVFVSAVGPIATMAATNPEGEVTEVVWTFSDENNAVAAAEGENLILTRAIATP